MKKSLFKRLISMAISTVLLSTSVLGCGSNSGSSADGDNAEYRQVYSEEIKTLNYLKTAETNEFGALANMVDTLVEYDKYGVVKPCLATEWSANEDNTVWTFKIREGVKWVTKDGDEYADVEAQDFVDSLKYVLNNKNESETADIAAGIIKNGEKFYSGEITDFNEVGVKAVDKYTLQYTLEKPAPYFLSMLTYVCFFPVNGKFLEEKGDEFGTDPENILYNGGYVFDTFEPQSSRVYVANDKYWDKDNIKIKRIKLIYNKEASTLAPEMYLRNEIDYVEQIPSDLVEEWFKSDEKKDIIHQRKNGFYSYFYAFNFDPQFSEEYEPVNWKKAVNNENFRQAIFHALDRKAAIMVSEPYDPQSQMLNTITPKNFVDIKGTDYTQVGGLAEVTNRDSYDENTAKEFKEKAMKELQGSVTFPVKVLLPYNSGTSDNAKREQVVEQQLERTLGTDFIDVQIEAKPPTGYLKDVRRAGNYALLLCNWGPDYADPETYSDPFATGGSYNKPELAENGVGEEYEKMLDEAKAESTDIQKRYELFASAESYLINKALVIPYTVNGGTYEVSKLNPFDAQFSPFGVISEKFKGQTMLEKSMSNEEYKAALEKWQSERTEALKKSA